MEFPIHLFVYGTLRKGFNHSMASMLETNATWMGSGFIYGDLYDLGSYPGIVLTNTMNKIIGDLFQVSSQKLLDSLDAYEGPEYIKNQTIAFMHDTTFNCTVYEFIEDISLAKQIVSGDYLLYLNS